MEKLLTKLHFNKHLRIWLGLCPSWSGKWSRAPI